LEPKASPKYLSVYSFFRTEHSQEWLIVGCIDLRLLDIHSWPCCLYQRPKFLERVWIVVPDISKVSGRTMRKQGVAGGFPLVQLFVMLYWTKNRNKANIYAEVLSERRWRRNRLT
jgi:hypothetical protein